MKIKTQMIRPLTRLFMNRLIGSGFILLAQLFTSAHADVQWLDSIVAVAGKQVITQSELNDEERLIKHQLRSRDAKIPPSEALSRQILERLISKKLQLQAATQAGIRIDDETLERAVTKIAGDNGMSVAEFRRALQSEGIGFREFRSNIREELIMSTLHERQINRRVNVTDQEIEDLIEESLGGDSETEYFLSHILISVPGAASPDEIETAKKKVKDIRDQANEGKDFNELAITHSDGQKALQGGELGWRKSAQLPSIFSSVIKTLKNGEISQPIRSPSGFHLVQIRDTRGDASKTNSVETLSRHILIKAGDGKTQLSKIRRAILAGEDFATLAKKHSEDPGSGKEGGDLGWNFPGTFVPAFEAALATLEKDEISEPFKSRFGWHIIQLMDKRNASVPDQILRERARKVLTQQKQEEDLQLWIRRLRDESFVEYRLPGMEPTS